MSVNAREEFELAYYNLAIQHVNHYTTTLFLFEIWFSERKTSTHIKR